jgi:hypothetical protein
VTASARWPATNALVAGACLLFLLTCVFSVGGLGDSRPWGDVGNYQRYGGNLVHGQIPYHDFYMEYPPGALPVFVAPAALTGRHDDDAYLFRFKLLMVACGIGTLLLMARVLTRLGASRERFAVALGAYALVPLVLGHVFLNRYDLWPTLLFVGTLLAVLERKALASGGLLGAAFAAKLFALAAAPVLLVRVWRDGARSGVVRAVAGFAGVSALCFSFFVVRAFGGLGFSFSTQLKRHLQTESLGASLLLAADRLGLYHAHVIAGKPGSIDLGGRLPDLAAYASSALALALVALVTVRFARGQDDDERLVLAVAASVVVFTVFAKALSPQFLTWIVPLVLLSRGRPGRVGAAVLLVALGLTQLENEGFHGLSVETWAVWTILLRNLVLVGLAVLLLRELRAPVEVRAASRRAEVLRTPAPGRVTDAV